MRVCCWAWGSTGHKVIRSEFKVFQNLDREGAVCGDLEASGEKINRFMLPRLGVPGLRLGRTMTVGHPPLSRTILCSKLRLLFPVAPWTSGFGSLYIVYALFGTTAPLLLFSAFFPPPSVAFRPVSLQKMLQQILASPVCGIYMVSV